MQPVLSTRLIRFKIIQTGIVGSLVIASGVSQERDRSANVTRALQLQQQKAYQVGRLAAVDEKLRQTFVDLMGATRGTIDGMQDMTFGMAGGSIESWKKVERGADETILRLRSGHGAMAIAQANQTAEEVKRNLLPILDLLNGDPKTLKAALKTLTKRAAEEYPAAAERAASQAALLANLKQRHRQEVMERGAAIKRLQEIDDQLAQIPADPIAKQTRPTPSPHAPIPMEMDHSSLDVTKELDHSSLDDAIDILGFLENGDRYFRNVEEMNQFFIRYPSLQTLPEAVTMSPERLDTLKDLQQEAASKPFKDTFRAAKCRSEVQGEKNARAAVLNCTSVDSCRAANEIFYEAVRAWEKCVSQLKP